MASSHGAGEETVVFAVCVGFVVQLILRSDEVDIFIRCEYDFAVITVDIGCGGGDAVFGFELDIACGINLCTYLISR